MSDLLINFHAFEEQLVNIKLETVPDVFW